LPDGKESKTSCSLRPFHFEPESDRVYVHKQNGYAPYAPTRIPRRYAPTNEPIIPELSELSFPVHCDKELLGHFRLGVPVGIHKVPIPNPLSQINEFDDQIFDHYVEQLPPWEQSLLRSVQPTNSHFLTYESLYQESITPRGGTPGFLGASDGSVRHQQGTFGWVLARTDGTILARGKGPAFGHPMDSYRAEGYGHLSLLLYVTHLADCYRKPMPPNIHSLTDSESLIKTIQRFIRRTRPVFPSDTMEPSWDIIQAVVRLQKRFEHYSIAHVKGHRDREVRPEDLTIQEQMNVEADRLAGEFQDESNHKDDLVPLIEGCGAQLSINGRTIISHQRRHTRQMRKTQWLRECLQRKLQLSDDTFDDIDWESHKSCVVNFKGQRSFLI
jgi:ribonuclease HI